MGAAWPKVRGRSSSGAHDKPNRSPSRFSTFLTTGAKNGRAAERSTASRASNRNQFAGVNRRAFRGAIRCAAPTHGCMGFRRALRDVRCPVPVMAGGRDPITPILVSEEIAACLPPGLVRFRRFAGCGRGVAAPTSLGKPWRRMLRRAR